MRTASGYQAPAVPYHTLICGSLSTPNTALVRKNAEYITNTEMWGLASPPRPHESAGRFTPIFKERDISDESDVPPLHTDIVYPRLSERQPVGCHL